ncbi:MAG TPA: multiheme c-type cytochrome [Candidatus Angelobacter sp.]|nr:multiheme c-type cytochrome [Candidatus Angelobacter sp.]
MHKILASLIFLIPATVFADQAKGPQTAEYCGDCHRAIYDGWKRSAHATAMESRLFQDALRMTESDFGGDARNVCLRCHSPLAASSGDLSLMRKVSWEGITCDYCHSVQDVTPAGGNHIARVEFNGVKSGPSADAVSPVHGTRFSKVHTTSLVCSACHDYRNSLGFQVLTTYSEWEKSPYAKAGQQCQSCHMYGVQGKVVDVRVTNIPAQGINLHQMPGSRSVEQLNRAIQSQISTKRQGDKVNVIVKLTNAGAGHYVPTGSPMRKLILEVRLDPFGEGQALRAERVYARTIRDQKGAPVGRENVAFLKGAAVVEDTRLAPKETRTETFSFDLPPGRRARVEANLYYFYSPMALTEAEQKIKFMTVSRLVE